MVDTLKKLLVTCFVLFIVNQHWATERCINTTLTVSKKSVSICYRRYEESAQIEGRVYRYRFRIRSCKEKKKNLHKSLSILIRFYKAG